jgi:drug/metabolite transporter (DMT)-like permease
MAQLLGSTVRLALLTTLTLIAFAANSLLCRAALDNVGMDAASFTLVRLASGAAMLSGLMALSGRVKASRRAGSWCSGAALLGYALFFSLAYRSIPAGVGALVLFAAVQLTMLTSAVLRGSGPRGSGWVGVALSLGGLALLTLPGSSAPDLPGVLLMTGSGVAWGIYSLRGRGGATATEATAGNFLCACVLSLPACSLVALLIPLSATPPGIALAAVSGAITSGLGYVLWYAVLPPLGMTRAAVLQLSVPVITTVAGTILLAEALTPRLLLASAAILGGIALVLRSRLREDSDG